MNRLKSLIQADNNINICQTGEMNTSPQFNAFQAEMNTVHPDDLAYRCMGDVMEDYFSFNYQMNWVIIRCTWRH